MDSKENVPTSTTESKDSVSDKAVKPVAEAATDLKKEATDKAASATAETKEALAAKTEAVKASSGAQKLESVRAFFTKEKKEFEALNVTRQSFFILAATLLLSILIFPYGMLIIVLVLGVLFIFIGAIGKRMLDKVIKYERKIFIGVLIAIFFALIVELYLVMNPPECDKTDKTCKQAQTELFDPFEENNRFA